MDYHQKLDAVEQDIKALENSEEYKALAKKNRAWADPKLTEAEKGEWGLLKEKLDELKERRRDYVQIILSTNAHSKDAAVKDERLLLSDVAIKMWERFNFALKYDAPTFGDFMEAAGFDGKGARNQGKVEKDEIKESLSRAEWIALLDLSSHVNPLLHHPLVEKEDGSLRLVLEHEIYEQKAGLFGNLIHKLYGPDKKVDIKDASSDSSESSI
ncbi:hypothetical protein MP638_001198 [Amoeboaphelidium occidentale]|nr:hypothetical protein MP638_001198 [Amoeboaphelidium occidentale]